MMKNEKKILRILVTKKDNFEKIKSNNNYQSDLIFCEKGQFYIGSKSNHKYEKKIEIIKGIIKFEKEEELKELTKMIIEIINVSIKEVKLKTSDSTVGAEREKNIIEGMVASCVNRCSYESVPMIHFINQIFIRILAGHYFVNGNKRIGIMTLRNILFWSGYYLKFSSTYRLMDLKKYELICEKFVKNLQGKNCSNFELKEVIDIRQWIENNIIFAKKLL